MEDQEMNDIVVEQTDVYNESVNDASQTDEVSKLKETLRKLQSQKDQILNEKRILEKQFQETAKPKEEKQLPKMPNPPQRPRDVYDQNEMEKYLTEQDQYNRDIAVYNQYMLEESLKPVREYQQKLQVNEESAKLKATVLSQFQEAGATLEIANTAYTLFAEKANERTPEEWIVATKAILEHRRGGKKQVTEEKQEPSQRGVANLNGVNESTEPRKLQKTNYFALK